MENEQGSPMSDLQDVNKQAAYGCDKTAQALDAVIDVLEDIQGLASKGRPKALRVKFGDKTVAEVPIALTAAAALGAGLAAVLLSKLVIEIVHED
ncbi:MAG: hypothetical protein M1133_11110 [Armatimonadetes bacterium]|nr:hypothetical protein [Armatimonadota bacterium]